MTTPNLTCCGITLTDRYPEVWLDPFLPAEYRWVYTCRACGDQHPVEVYTEADKAEVFEAANPTEWIVLVAE